MNSAAFFVHVVIRVQFASATYSGKESSGEILITVIITGGTSNLDISVTIGFSEVTAIG